MDTSKTTAILITEEDFDNAIVEVTQKNLTDSRFNGSFQAALMYSTGGMVFAKEVKNILFGKEENHDKQS